jgi:nitrogenase molybdenum-iron protein alpha/beta subunit
VTGDWRNHGLCLVPAYRPLYADRRPLGYTKQRQNREAKATCGRCPVRERCLAEALEEEGDAPLVMRQGIRGGLTAKERVARARARQQ